MNRRQVEVGGGSENRFETLTALARDRVKGIGLDDLISPEYATRLILLTEKQVSRLTGFAPRTFQGWRQRGGGPRFVEISPRCIRYRLCDIEGWIRERLRTSTSQG